MLRLSTVSCIELVTVLITLELRQRLWKTLLILWWMLLKLRRGRGVSIVVGRRRKMPLMMKRWRRVRVAMRGRRWILMKRRWNVWLSPTRRFVVVKRRLTISSYTLSLGWIRSMMLLKRRWWWMSVMSVGRIRN
jgi:hypothetical protein